jgi:DNA-damage-inducible protein D
MADAERLGLRKQTAEEFKALSGAAQDAGVQSKMFGVFHDAGYKGLYGGLGRDAIKQRETIANKDNLLDRMNATELAANQFRMTQTRDKLARDAIKRIGGTLPENIPPAEHIKEVEKRIKQTTPKLTLAEREANGLLGRRHKS